MNSKLQLNNDSALMQAFKKPGNGRHRWIRLALVASTSQTASHLGMGDFSDGSVASFGIHTGWVQSPAWQSGSEQPR